MQRRSFARLGLSAAVAATALASLLIGPGSAAAGVQNRCFYDGWMSATATTIDAWLFYECVNPESSVPVQIILQRYNPNTDIWDNVATGKGHAVYHCAGTTPSYFHMKTLPNDYILANCS